MVEAFRHPRELNGELIDAYLARRALDYLVGFTLSPVLWRKLPGSRSAGRVQSVALRLICEREAEIEVFRPQEYWTIDVALRNPADAPFSARLTHLDGRKLDRSTWATRPPPKPPRGASRRPKASWSTASSASRPSATPYPPFTTSTLQQEASRKLGFGATRTMRLAQQLYEGIDLGGETVGLITYMRTDGVQISQEAISAREVIFQQLRRPLPARLAAALQDQGQERPGSPRGDPADRHTPAQRRGRPPGARRSSSSTS